VARGNRTHAQFIRHQLEASQRAHARNESHIGYRLGEEVVGARIEPPDAVGGLVERSDHDDGNMVGRQPCLQAATDLEAVHIRHHDVQQHEIAFCALANRQCILASDRGNDVEIFR
jgi:hypothetical protein